MPALEHPLEISVLLTGLLGGLALFLYGMRKMSDALKTAAGDGMKNLLASLTRNRFTAALAGTIITGVIQSSSVTTVLIVGFISAGLLNLSQSIGVIIGANIGTTITAQIIAFKVYKYGLLMIASGFFVEILARKKRTQHWGTALMGLGLLFFGMQLMSDATGPLREWPPFIHGMQSISSPFAGVFIGMAFTAVVQSSSATTGIVIVLASQGLLSLELGIAILFGANIGTCVTAALSAFGRPREAVQAAWVHIIFNVGGVLLWIFFIPQFAELVRLLSPASQHLDATQRLAGEAPRQLANAHTIFNIINAILFIGFTDHLARLVERLVPRKAKPQQAVAMYLDNIYLEQPALALDQTRREILRLARLGRASLSRVFRVVTEGREEQVQELAKADSQMDALHGEIIRYLGKLSQRNLVEDQSEILADYMAIANDLESFGDVIQDNLLHNAMKRLRLNIQISVITLQTLQPVYKKVCESYDQILQALEHNDQQAAKTAAKSKKDVHKLAEAATSHLTKRLAATEPNRVAAFKIESDIIEHLVHINLLIRRIARNLSKVS